MTEITKEDLFQFIEDNETKGKKAEVIIEAFQKGHVKSANYRREAPKGYDEYLRQLVIQSVYGRWNLEHKVSTLNSIFRDVTNLVKAAIDREVWPSNWLTPSKRTIDRRVNETADITFWTAEGTTPTISLKPGTYCPNPARFEEESRVRLMEAIRS